MLLLVPNLYNCPRDFRMCMNSTHEVWLIVVVPPSDLGHGLFEKVQAQKNLENEMRTFDSFPNNHFKPLLPHLHSITKHSQWLHETQAELCAALWLNWPSLPSSDEPLLRLPMPCEVLLQRRLFPPHS